MQTIEQLDSEAIIANVEALLPMIRSRSADVAAARRLPLDLVAMLKRAGAFRVAMPREWGGPEMSMPDQLRLFERLCHADPSVGWCVMIGCDAGFYSSFLDDDAGRALWPNLDMVTAGWVMPAGRARRVDRGFVVDGRWSFGSGCTHADVIVSGCMIVGGDGAPEIGADGQPVTRNVLASAANFEIIDTWHTTGLAGSGSNDYRCANVFVPDEHTFAFDEPVRRSGPLYRFPGAFTTKWHGVVLGIARRAALDEATAIVDGKMLLPQGIRMRDVPRAQAELAVAEMRYRASRAYSYSAVENLWRALLDDRPLSNDLRIDMVLSRVEATRMARDVTLSMMQLVGTQAIFTSCVLDQLVRDALTVAQHVSVSPMMVETAGAMLFGHPPVGPLAAIL